MDVLIHLDLISAHVILDSYVLAGNLRGGEGITVSHYSNIIMIVHPSPSFDPNFCY